MDQTGKNRPTSFETEKGTAQRCLILQKQEKDKGFTVSEDEFGDLQGRTMLTLEKDTFIAWGQEVGGLQAGLGFRPGQKRAYRRRDGEIGRPGP